MYYIWFDESDKEGKYYSNFYGGILIESKNLEDVLFKMKTAVDELGIKDEIKWQKANEFTFNKYCSLIDFIFDVLLSQNLIKLRIFFRSNQNSPIGLTKEQKKRTYSNLYYQFMKHGFGLQYSNDTNTPIYLKLLIDEIPLKGDDKETFKHFIYGLNKDENFKKANIKIKKEDICEVNSKKHLPLQFMDLILGSICFRLNDKHKIKPEGSRTRGRRTIFKEKLYKHINHKISELKPGFNIGISTGLIKKSDTWNDSYRHWNFVPHNSIKDVSYIKQKNNPS